MESTGRSSSPHSSTNASLAVDVATEQHRQQSTNIGSPVVVPPYWQTHQRGESLISIDSNRLSNPFIRLVDNTEQASEQSKGLWAKSAQIAEYVVIRGAAPGIGDYVVWTCKVETLNGGAMILRKRYSEFDKLRRNLVKTFPQSIGSIPPLPRKSVIHKFQEDFLERRREGLSYFLNCILLNPEFAGSPVLKDFVFT